MLVDEMHFGYIAWSIAETGRDEHGVPTPLVFEGFGDQKLPGQVYLLVPLIKLFGLSNTVVRLPSAVAGALLPLAIYWLIRQGRFSKTTALVTATSTAIIPWTFMLSRFGLEANIGLLFYTLGLGFGVRWLREDQAKQQHRWLSPSLTGFFLALSWYLYISYRPVTVAILLMLMFLKASLDLRQKPTRTRWQRQLITSGLIFSLLVSPFFQPAVIESNQARLNQVGIFAESSVTNIVNQHRTFCVESLPKLICYSLWNKPLVIGQLLLNRWLEVYSPQFLSISGSNQLTYLTLEHFGQLYLPLYLVFLIGFVSLLQRVLSLKLQRSNFQFVRDILILFGLLVSPVPSLLAGDAQPVRLTPVIPFVLLILAFGFSTFQSWLNTLPAKTSVLLQLLFGLGLLGLTSLYYIQFFTIHHLKNELAYDSYLPDFFEFVSSVPTDTTIATRKLYSDPIMYYAYYTRFDPKSYQDQVVLGELEPSGFRHATRLGNFSTTDALALDIACESAARSAPALYITNEKLQFPIVYQATSHHGVHAFFTVYDVTSTLQPADCKKYQTAHDNRP